MINDKQTLEKNLELRNAVMMSYHNRLMQRASEINKEIQNDLATHVSDSKTDISISQTGARLVEVHSLTLTYFEGVAFQFLRWGWEINHKLVNYVKEEIHGEFPEGPPHRWDDDEKDLRINHRQWMNVLNKLDPSTNHFDALHVVKERRNNYIHRPDTALKFRLTSDNYLGKQLEEKSVEMPEYVQRQQEQPTLKEILVDCENAIKEINEVVDKHLPINEDLYSSLTEHK